MHRYIRRLAPMSACQTIVRLIFSTFGVNQLSLLKSILRLSPVTWHFMTWMHCLSYAYFYTRKPNNVFLSLYARVIYVLIKEWFFIQFFCSFVSCVCVVVTSICSYSWCVYMSCVCVRVCGLIWFAVLHRAWGLFLSDSFRIYEYRFYFSHCLRKLHCKKLLKKHSVGVGTIRWKIKKLHELLFSYQLKVFVVPVDVIVVLFAIMFRDKTRMFF